MTAAVFDPEPVPLTRDAAGRLMVMGTRVPLDTLVAAFEQGDSLEAIHKSYPTVSLGDIYAIFTYCVRHRDEVIHYLADRAEQRAELKAEAETRFPGRSPRQALGPARRMTVRSSPTRTSTSTPRLRATDIPPEVARTFGNR